MTRTLTYFYLFASALTLCLVFVPWVERLARRYNVVDLPAGRKSHEQPRPLLGGLAIFAAFMIVVAGNLVGLLALRGQAWMVETLPLLVRQVPRLAPAAPKLVGILLGGSIVLLVGCWDDVRKNSHFSLPVKLTGQILAAALAVSLGVHTTFLPGDLLDYAVSLLWIVGITNAFNFLDNMDGLSAGVAAIAATLFWFLTARQGQFFSAMIFAAFTGSVLGFLPYNFHPARLFMGDAGSLFIGFTLASLAITSSYVLPQSAGYLPVLMPVLVLSLPLFDTLSVLLIRLRERRPLYIGDRRHFSHRLVDLGMTQRQAVLFIYLIALDVGLAATLLPYVPVWGAAVIVAQALVVYGVITFLMVTGMRRRNP
jgi:UDP-GlcNAc:undecaprenyl-phosphate GlcNAc-1-phosphate transferase